MKLDVLKETPMYNFIVSGWKRGSIAQIFYKNEQQDQQIQLEQSKQIDGLLIVYDQDLDSSSIQLSIQDWRFAPLNTFTQDFEWRYNLQQGDNIDCMDNEREWYKSTVLKFRYQNNRDKEKVQEIFVGYRNYHPEGSKTDEDGEKYFGWSEKYDNWIPISDIRVQKYHSIHSQYIKVEQQNKQYSKSLDFDDRADIISSNHMPVYFSSPRSSYFSKFEIISDALNIFGAANGFEAIVNNLKEASVGKIQLTLSTLNSYCLFLSSTMPLWHRQFCCNYIDRFNDSLLKCLCFVNTEANDQNKLQINLGPIQNDNFSCGLLEDIINKHVDPIWKRYNTLEMSQQIQYSYQIGIGSALLSHSKLERRIQGLKYINEVIKAIKQPYQIFKLVTTKDLISILRKHNIIEQIFGERTHFELVHRSQDLIRLLFNEKDQLLEGEIDMIWNVCIKQGEQIKLEIYNNILQVIKSTYGNLSDNIKSIFINKINSIQPNLLIEKDIQLLYELSKKQGINFQKTEEFIEKAVNIMWQISVLEKDFPIQLIKIARKNFQELISSWDDSYKEPYIAQCIENIVNNKMPLQNLKIASKLIESMNQNCYAAAERQTRQDFSKNLIETQDLIGIIIQDLDRFIDYSNICVKKGEITLENYNTINKEQSKFLSEEIMIDLFRQKIVQGDFRMLKSLKITGLDCIVRLFVLVNEIQGNVLDLVPKTQENNWNNQQYNSYGNNSYNYNYRNNNNQDQNSNMRFNRFRVNIIPQDLEGINVLWSMMKAVDISNQSLFLMVQRTLINIYSNLSTMLLEKRSQINDCFMIECMKCLESINLNNFILRNEKEKKDSLTFICKTITAFLEGTEQFGIGKLKIQRQLDLTQYANNLTFEIKMPIKKGIDASYIELNTYLNMSVWELKQLIAKNIDASPLTITFKRIDSKKPEIKDFHNLNLLSDFNISNNEKFQVIRAKNPDIQEVPLIDKSGKVVPELTNILNNIFNQFSIDKTKDQIIDEIYQKCKYQQNKEDFKKYYLDRLAIIPDNVRVMTPQTCCLFIQKATQVQNIAEEDYKVLNLFSNYSKKIEFGNLLLDEFIKFYQDQAKQKSEVVRNNLNYLGFQSDLKEKVDLNDLNWSNDKRVVKDETLLPRYKLSQDQQLFQSLLNLVETSQCDEQDGLWQLLVNIQTNQVIYDQILNLSDLDNLLDLNNLSYNGLQLQNYQINFRFHKILYILQIVQSLISEYKKKNECFATLHFEQNDSTNNISQNKSNIQASNNQEEESYWQIDDDNYQKNDEQQQANRMDVDLGNGCQQEFTFIDDSNQIQENKNNYNDDSNNEIDRNPKNQSQNLDPQEAIAMPYNGPFVSESASPIQQQYSNDVPIAPACQAALIGPPNSQNTYSNPKLKIQGAQVKQLINCQVSLSDEDVMKRKNWLPKFLQIGGINKLICLLRNLSHIHRQVENQNSKNQINVNEKIIKRCLKEVMECIKVLIVGQLTAQSNDQNITLSLTKKISVSNQQIDDNPDQLSNLFSPKDVEMNDESYEKNEGFELIQNDLNLYQEKDKNLEIKKSKIQEEQINTEEEMKPLIDLIKNNQNLRFNFKQDMDLFDFQSEILGLISEFIDKMGIKQEDYEIVNQGLGIWLSCLVSEPKLLNSVYQEFDNSIQYDQLIYQPIVQNINFDENIFHFSKTLVEKGIVSSEFRIREAFQNSVLFIVSTIKSTQLQMPPLFFFIKLLITKFDYISQRHLSKQTRIFFSLLMDLLNQYFQERHQIQFQSLNQQQNSGSQMGLQIQSQEELINGQQFLIETINRLLNYESTEKRNSLADDFTLVGLFDVIRIFIENSVNSLTSLQFQELSIMLIDKCLFNMNFLPLDKHIVQSVDLQQYESQIISKCLTKESTQACFNLLIKICRYSQDKTLVFNIFLNYFLKLIFIVDKPALPGFSPSANGRSTFNYSGIKNLGAVCYMNSMNQQFFNIPTLRYCLLATQDNIPENIVVSEIAPYSGMQIDDNVLHQMMKMFGFLELTDRQCFDPTQLCFSVKNFGEPTNVREQKDAQEYLNIMFDQLEQQLKNTSQKYLIQNVFGGKFCQKKKCKNCGNVRSSYEDLLNISLEVKNQKSIYEALRKFVQGEIIQDFNCEACNKKVDLEKQTSIEQLPNTLIIHLQRIIFDFDQLTNVKLNDRVEFPEILNMKEFMTSEIEKKELSNQQQRNQQNQNQPIEKEEGKNDEEKQIIQQPISSQQESNSLIQQNEIEEKQESRKNTDQDEDYVYRLVGVVDHMGSADAGHYLSFINVERDQDFNLHKKGQKISREDFFATEKYTWLEFNDKLIQSFKVKDLETLCFGGQGNQNAYMLVYEKMLKRKIKIVVPKQIIDLFENDSLACDGTAITRDSSKLQNQYENQSQNIINSEEITLNSNNMLNTQYSTVPLDSIEQIDFHLLHVFPDFIAQLKNQQIQLNDSRKLNIPELENENKIISLSEFQTLYFDKEKNEYIALMNFEDVRKFVPNNIYKSVHQDNFKFLLEKQIFSEVFFNSMLQLVEIASIQLNLHSDETNINMEQYEIVYRVVDRLMFDLIANSQYVQTLKGMSDIMNLLLLKSDQAVIYLLQNRIFIPQENLMKDEKNFFETLSTHANQEVREMASSILLTVLNRLILIGGIQNENFVISAIQKALNQMDEECPKHWMRIDTYLNFIYRLVQSNSIFLRILLQNKIVFKLVTLFNKCNSNQMVYSNARPPFDKLVQTISTIVRIFPCLVDLYDIDNIYQQEGYDKQTFLYNIQNERGCSGYNIHIQMLYSQEQLEIEHTRQWLQLSDECLKALFLQQKSLKTFLQNITKNGYSISDFSSMIAHLCFKNKQYSLKIAKHILKGTNSCGADELQPFLFIMKEFLLINDQFRDQRIEWIFGIPSFVIQQNIYQNYNQKPKIGVSFADHIGSQVCKYISPIYKTSSKYYNRKDCALQALFSNRKNQSKAVLFSLKTIFEAIMQDQSNKIQSYLKCMDPPTYQFARYQDWIKPWVLSEVESNTRNQNMYSYRNELELSINVLSLIEQIELLNQPPNLEKSLTEINQNTIIEYPENDNGPKPYLIWEISGDSLYNKQQDVTNRITVQINEIACSVSTSFPTGENNLALLDQFSSNSYQQNQGNQGGTGFIKSSSLKNSKGAKQNHQIKRRQGRERPSKSIQKQPRSNQINENAQPLRIKKKGNKQKQNLNINNDDADSEEASDEENYFVDKQDSYDNENQSSNVNQDQIGQKKNVRFAENQCNDENIQIDQIDNQDIIIPEFKEEQSIQKTPTASINGGIDLKSNDNQEVPNPQSGKSVAASQNLEHGEDLNKNDNLYESPKQNKDGIDSQQNIDNNQNDQDQQNLNQNANFDEDQEEYYAENEEQNNQEDLQDQDNQDEDFNEIDQYKSDCLLSFKAENNLSYTQTIELTLSPKKDADGNNLPCNFKIPKSSILFEISPGQNSNILQITKLDPKLDEWGQFEWKFNLFIKKVIEQCNLSDNYKSCPDCTFQNSKTRLNCEMCDARL